MILLIILLMHFMKCQGLKQFILIFLKKKPSNSIKDIFYIIQKKIYYSRINYNIINKVHCVLQAFSGYDISQNNYIHENFLYIIPSDNGKIIKYWNINKELQKNYNLLLKSYIIYSPYNLVTCHFTKDSFEKANILQSNENYNTKTDTAYIPGFNEYQNFNGILFNSSV